MKRVVLAGIIAFLLLFVLVVPSTAQQANVTITTPITTLNTTNAVANATGTTNATAKPSSFLSAANNATAPPVPGFESLFAIAGLACAALLLLRRRR